VCFLSSLLFVAQAEPDSSKLDHPGTPVVFQVSTLDALSLGLYQGVYTIAALKRRGNFGLGKFEGIDGEMTILNGHFYHFRSDGAVTEEPDGSRVPFAVISRKPSVNSNARMRSLHEGRLDWRSKRVLGAKPEIRQR
jgi:alpha-acetolactate decarboxylase